MWRLKKRPGKDKGSAILNDKETTQSSSPAVSFATTIVPHDGGPRRQRKPASPQRLHSPPLNLSVSSTFGLPERSRTRPDNRSYDPMGLTVVHNPEKPPSLDIIFVHGLGGTSRATWSWERDPEYFWPGKWLRFEPDIRTARILSFGYNANFAATGSTPITGVMDFAKDLLHSMKFAKDDELEELEIGQRPLVFIAHSMGGLIVKQAYLLGQYDDQFANIVSSIKAIMFLATPHRGSDLADTLNRILTVSIFNHTPKLYISELSTGSQTIQGLNEQFRHVAPKLDIFSFYETLQTSVGPKKMMVVEKSSATLGHSTEISKPLYADHHGICKYKDAEDANYISVRNTLKTLVSGIRSKDRSILETHGADGLEKVRTLLAVSETHQDDLTFFRGRWTEGTCHWILSHRSFTDWADENENTAMLWLHALPASGKSILSAFIVDHLADEENESFCAYYFFRFGDQSKRSLSNCLRTIALQIAAQLPKFRRMLEQARFPSKSLGESDAKTIWEMVFMDILFKMTLSSTMYWIIDGLDESDQPQLLVEFLQAISLSSMPFKVLLVSRQTPELIETFDRLSVRVPVVHLPIEQTKIDIRVVLEREVQYMRAPPDSKAQIVQKLANRANGNFLWASLAQEEVKRCNTQEDLDDILNIIPAGMEKFYQRMENTIIENTRPRDQKLGQIILTWAVCSHRPLTLAELGSALQPEFSLMLDPKFIISRVCGQFIIVDSADQLVVVHQTARDHILKTTSPLAVRLADGHEWLFKKCMAVLDPKSGRRDLERRSASQKAPESNDFVRYAMTSWAYHLNHLSSGSDAPLTCLKSFLGSQSVLAWIALLASEDKLKTLVDSSKSMSSYVRKKREHYAEINPLLHQTQTLELIGSWSVDFLKILGKFGQNLLLSPSSVYHQVAPFCPRNSMIYRQFQQNTPQPHSISVQGLSKPDWDDSLARMSLGHGVNPLIIQSSGDHIAVLSATGNTILYHSATFALKRTLVHGQRVCAMRLSSNSNLLATYGFRTTKIWSVNTGQVMYEIQNPRGSQAFTMKFSNQSSKLVIGSNDSYIRVAYLNTPQPSWTILHPNILKGDMALDRPVHTVPLRIAFNADASAIAVSYRGAPLSVWSLDPPELVGRCMRNKEYAGNSWTVVDRMVWHPDSEEILGLYQGGIVCRWNPYDDVQREVQGEGSVLACSQDGKFFAVGDPNGIINLYDFHHFTLIYQLSCGIMVRDIYFSPDSKRLYDIRGQFCNVWEPNALIRSEDSGDQNSEIASEVSSLPTTSVSEAVSEVRDQITAVAVQSHGLYHAIGNQAGIVSVVNLSHGEHITTELWKSELPLPVGHLDWSIDGQHLACSELSGRVVVKQVQHERGERWSTPLVFDVRILLSSEGIQQVLLNSDGTILFVKHGRTASIWRSSQSPGSHITSGSITSEDGTKWYKHPTDSRLLVCCSPDVVRIHSWDDLSELMVCEINRPTTPGADDIVTGSLQLNRILPAASGSSYLMDTTLSTSDGQEHLVSIFELPPLARQSAINSPSAITLRGLPQVIQQQIEIPLAVLHIQGLMFLDKNYWMCSYRINTGAYSSEKVHKHYFLPKDWLNVEHVGLCALLENGDFLIPNNGELAVISCTGIR